MNEEGEEVLRQLFRFAAKNLGHEFSSFCGRAWARLSCTLQRSVAQAILNRVDGNSGSPQVEEVLPVVVSRLVVPPVIPPFPYGPKGVKVVVKGEEVKGEGELFVAAVVGGPVPKVGGGGGESVSPALSVVGGGGGCSSSSSGSSQDSGKDCAHTITTSNNNSERGWMGLGDYKEHQEQEKYIPSCKECSCGKRCGSGSSVVGCGCGSSSGRGRQRSSRGSSRSNTTRVVSPHNTSPITVTSHPHHKQNTDASSHAVHRCNPPNVKVAGTGSPRGGR